MKLSCCLTFIVFCGTYFVVTGNLSTNVREGLPYGRCIRCRRFFEKINPLKFGVGPPMSRETTRLRMEPNYNPLWVQTGSPFSATCVKEAPFKVTVGWTVNGGQPALSGFHVKNSTVLVSAGRVRSSAQLTKGEVGLDDFGPSALLLCQADVPGSEDKEELFISVHFFNVFVEHPNITEGEDISLKCVPDQPASTVIWSLHGNNIDNSTERRSLADHNTTLVLRNSHPRDAGLYRCQVWLLAGINNQTKQPLQQSFLLDVPVSGKPYLVKKTPSRVAVNVNDTLILTCPVAGFPTPDVFWLRGDDSPVQLTKRLAYAPHNGIADATLKIQSVQRRDLGVYECVAQNSVGWVVKHFRVGLGGGVSSEHSPDLCVGVLVVGLWATVWWAGV